MVFTEHPAPLFPQMQRGAFEELWAASPNAKNLILLTSPQHKNGASDDDLSSIAEKCIFINFI